MQCHGQSDLHKEIKTNVGKGNLALITHQNKLSKLIVSAGVWKLSYEDKLSRNIQRDLQEEIEDPFGPSWNGSGGDAKQIDGPHQWNGPKW